MPLKRSKIILVLVGLVLLVSDLYADIYTDLSSSGSPNFIPNYRISSYAPFRFLATEDDEAGGFPFPTADPVDAWNPAELLQLKHRYLSVGFDNRTEGVDDSFQKQTFTKVLPYISSAYYVEPPSPLTIGVVAIGWSGEKRNFDFSPSASWINTYEREHWKGGVVFALPVFQGGLGMMLGYQRFHERKQDDGFGELFTQELQGFYGKVGFTYPVFPLLDLEGSYGYGGSLGGGRDGSTFFEREPTQDTAGNDFYFFTFFNPGPAVTVSVRNPDTLGGMLRFRPFSFLILSGGATDIFWSQYQVEDHNDIVKFMGTTYPNETISIVPHGTYRDVVQLHGGVGVNILNFLMLKAAVHTEPDPDKDSFYQINRNFGIASLVLFLDAFSINAFYIYGQGTSADGTVKDTVQNVRVGLTLGLGGGPRDIDE